MNFYELYLTCISFLTTCPTLLFEATQFSSSWLQEAAEVPLTEYSLHWFYNLEEGKFGTAAVFREWLQVHSHQTGPCLRRESDPVSTCL